MQIQTNFLRPVAFRPTLTGSLVFRDDYLSILIHRNLSRVKTLVNTKIGLKGLLLSFFPLGHANHRANAGKSLRHKMGRQEKGNLGE